MLWLRLSTRMPKGGVVAALRIPWDVPGGPSGEAGTAKKPPDERDGAAAFNRFFTVTLKKSPGRTAHHICVNAPVTPVGSEGQTAPCRRLKPWMRE
jgi:hypothetical protein